MIESVDDNLINNIPIAFAYRKIICDDDGRPCDYEFLKVNKAFALYSKNAIEVENAKGKRGSEVFPGLATASENWIKIFGEVALNNVTKEIEKYDAVVDKWFKINIYSPKKEYFVTLFTDITREKQALIEQKRRYELQNKVNQYQEQIQTQNRLQEIFLEISSEFIDMGIDQFDEIINKSIEKIGRAVDADRCYIFEYYYDTRTCSNIYEWCKEGIEPQIQNLSEVSFEILGDCQKKHETNNSMCILDVQTLLDNDPIKSFLLEQDIKSTLTVPMFNKGKCSGFVGFDSVLDNYVYSQIELGLLREFANILESAFQKIQLEIQRQESALKITELKTLFETTLMSVGDGVISTDIDGNIVLMNNIAQDLTGWDIKDAYGKSLEEIFPIVEEFTKIKKENPVDIVKEKNEIIQLENHTLLISKNGNEIPIEDSAAPIYDHEGNMTGVVLVFRDFTEKKQRQEEIEFLSYHDPLTTLFNDRFFEEKIEQINRRNIHIPLTLMYIDVNGLKLTNDAFGHQMGDTLLISVAKVLQQVCENMAFPCRTGGDEFILIIPHADNNKAKQVKEEIIENINKIKLDSVVVSIAIGYAIQESKDQPLGKILRMAEDEMYRNKLKYGKRMRELTIANILNQMSNKFADEKTHNSRVAKFCEILAVQAGISTENIKELRLAGNLHDIGKIIIPADILLKPDKLSREEFEMVKRHAEAGYQIVKAVDEYVGAATSILYHHERWDGLGYPQGLKEKEIPITARILSIADAFEAMTSDKPYRRKMPTEKALSELEKNAGTQFDPRLVELFVKKMRASSYT